MINHPGLSKTFPILKLKFPHPRKSFISGAVGLSKLETKLSLGMAMESRLGSR